MKSYQWTRFYYKSAFTIDKMSDYTINLVGFCANCKDKILELLKESTIIPQVVAKEGGQACNLLGYHCFNKSRGCQLLSKRMNCNANGYKVKLINDARRTLLKTIKLH